MNRIGFVPLILCVGVSASFVSPVLAQHEHPAGDPTTLAQVSFPVSCDPSAQPQFTTAVAMLHSCGYEKAHDTFADVAQKDATCGMAYWGSAMTYYDLIWFAAGATGLK